MATTSAFDLYAERLGRGERLRSDEIQELAGTPDVLLLGMLADTWRRRLHEDRVTFLRVAERPVERAGEGDVPAAAKEIRLTGSPPGLPDAVKAIQQVRAVAGDRTVSAYAWTDVERWAAGPGLSATLAALREAGLDALAGLPLDEMSDPEGAVDSLVGAGFGRLRLTISRAGGAARTDLLLRVGTLQDASGCIQAINPLPMALAAFRPTTGYDDVKAVAIARLAAPSVPTIQVDWQRYGPKLAQVALTFGADDVDNVSPAEEAPEGRRRAPLAEIRRNVEAAGLVPIERDGRFAVPS